ncbi:hypothetical protein NUW58_g2500 [Xylaria curta]|uniref:Uncharacterized protein n=1 Tax=Xylaria curta TaxID=42375 RepID=A0ACC1PFA1_9PEZI|nr:hypothetical protein NUW58_g2500 [Xylaria curta]
MLFSVLSFTVASLLCFAKSAPVNETSDLVILQQFTSKDGVSIITVYGDAVPSQPVTTEARGLDLLPRCGSNSLVCDDSHLADRGACSSLVDDLRGSGASLPDSPRSICATYSGKQCCVSWHNPVSEAIRDNLVAAAQKALDGCRGNTGVSGRTSDTLIGRTCTAQCLSDRATGC